MSIIKLFSCSSGFLARASAIHTNKAVTNGCLPAGVMCSRNKFSSTPNRHILTYPMTCKFQYPAVRLSGSVFGLTKYDNNKFFSTKPPIPVNNSKDNTPDQKSFATAQEQPANVNELLFGESSQLTTFQKFKLMYSTYWYVLIPVHVVTSLGWIFGFYYLSKSGVDIPSILQHLQLSESIIGKVKGSNMGHYAIAYLCYKVVTPFRYALSLGLTTVSIRRLVLLGYIKPLPTVSQFKKFVKQKAADHRKRKDEQSKAS